MRQILLDHSRRYPAMTPNDYIKLLYQSEFGGGHLIADPARALARLKDELATMRPETPAPAFESIGGGLMRLHLQHLSSLGLRPETANGLFLCACEPRGSMEGLNAKLDLLAETFPDMPGLAEAIADYRAAGCPAMSHTESYRSAYNPAYRLVPEAAAMFLPLLKKLDAMLVKQPFVRVAIDGRCAAGKSTLGHLLAKVYGANLFHMDDYFLPFPRKTPERLAEPGGNVDYERFYEEIGRHPKGAAVTWARFDCQTQSQLPPVTTEATPLTVVEGSYSLHPLLRGAYDLKIFLDIDPVRQSERILARSGPEMHVRFINEWIPMENHYFDALEIRALCDLAFDC